MSDSIHVEPCIRNALQRCASHKLVQTSNHETLPGNPQALIYMIRSGRRPAGYLFNH